MPRYCWTKIPTPAMRTSSELSIQFSAVAAAICGLFARSSAQLVALRLKRKAIRRGANMNTKSISRRQIIKGGGALVVSFSFWGPLSRALAQTGDAPQARPYAAERVDLGTFVPEPGDYLDARELD